MKKITIILIIATTILLLMSCSISSISGSGGDKQKTIDVANKLQTSQPTPTDIEYSLERYNLIRRVYWVNGMREKAISLPCEVEKPLGYIILFSGNCIIGRFVVDGKVTSLNSYLTPDSEYYEYAGYNEWLPDADGSYGENDNGIFFFTPDGKYIEWAGTYLYSDIPFEINDPEIIIKVE